MAGTRESDTLAPGAHVPTLAMHAVLGRPPTPERRMADAIRALTIDAFEASGGGHTGVPLAMADAAATLWTRFLRFDASDPRWPDRDRFVLSAGHGSMLLYALLCLTGHAGMELRDLARFRQLDSPATGHPEYDAHPAIEATTGPPGQGLANAVGMALAERMMAARFGRSLVDHRTWVIAADGDLMKGVSQEAVELAGRLRLEKLTVLWDESRLSADSASVETDVLKRFAAQGWATKRVDGHDPAQIAAALSLTMRSKKPTLIACRTSIGFVSAKSGAAAPSCVKLGREEARAAKRTLAWPHAPFTLPSELADRWAAVGARGGAARRAWLKRLARHPKRADFERALAGRLPDSWHERVGALKADFAETRPTLSGKEAGQRALAALAPTMPELFGGSAGLSRSAPAAIPAASAIGAGQYGGRHLHFGIREHAMAACLNGVALHRGLLPFATTFLAWADSMRPAIRLAAMMRLRVIYALTHDGIGVGEDGPTHQPIEHLASLRAMPGLHVFRPADAVETVECCELAVRRTDGPSLIALARQDLPPLRQDAAENRCARGGYVLLEADGARRATLIATGSEVAVAVDARKRLAESGIAAAVVSLPCWELFTQQDERYRLDVLGAAPRFGIEAACDFGWERWLGDGGAFIGMTGFGASAPADDLYRHFGITPESIAAAVKRRLLPN